MNTIGKYIVRRVLYGLFVAFLIITSVIVLVDFVETTRNFGGEIDLSMWTALKLTALHTPELLEQTIPFVVLFGVMGALFGLNKHSELIVLRASGLSAWKFLKPAVLVTGILGVIWSLVFNPFAARSADSYSSLSFAVSGGDQRPAEDKDIWLREGDEDGQLVIHARGADLRNHTLLDATFYYIDFAKDGRPLFSTRYDAERAELQPSKYWVLTNVTENEDGKLARKFERVSKTTNIDLETLRSRSQSTRQPAFWKLLGEIRNAKMAGFDTSRLILQLNRLLALPITLIAMTIIAAATSLNMSREGGTLRLMILGAALGFGVYFIDNIIMAFGETGALPPVLAAWSVPLLVLFLGIALLSRIEDG